MTPSLGEKRNSVFGKYTVFLLQKGTDGFYCAILKKTDEGQEGNLWTKRSKP